MKIWNRLQQLSIPKLLGFGWLLIQKPLLIIPIYKATIETMNISQKLYGNAHHGSGKANAFRHALWNFKICQKTLKFTKNLQKSFKWTQKVVDFYEKVSKNNTLNREMDFHNNAVGRDYFLANFEEIESKTIKKLQLLAEKSKKVSKINEFQQHKGILVYIEA